MEQEFFEIISEICYLNINEVHAGLSVTDDLAFNSVMMVELAAAVEKRMKKNIDDKINLLYTCDTLGEMYQIVAG